jgi:hypothetical protein
VNVLRESKWKKSNEKEISKSFTLLKEKKTGGAHSRRKVNGVHN